MDNEEPLELEIPDVFPEGDTSTQDMIASFGAATAKAFEQLNEAMSAMVKAMGSLPTIYSGKVSWEHRWDVTPPAFAPGLMSFEAKARDSPDIEHFSIADWDKLVTYTNTKGDENEREDDER